MSGLWFGIAAYTIWGLFPPYWKLVEQVPALQIIGHRIVWSFLALIVVGAVRLRGSVATSVRTFSVTSRVMGIYAAAAVLISINWFLYVYAVNSGRVLETSLGYFITPLVNVLLGVVVLRERLRPLQWFAVALAAGGVLDLTLSYGSLPWIAVGLAFSFGSYGLAKKKAPLDPLAGLTLETGIIVIPAAAYLFAVNADGHGAFLHTGPAADALLIGGGPVTVVPLLLFAAAVRRVPLTLIGLLQYVAPTIQLLLGVFVYGEPFAGTRLIGFAIVWTALALFSIDSLRARGLAGGMMLDEGAA
ncbi:MAG TPA: EamA family transporter RarD [Vicinamibacterales bacterium]|jgi:chloramphenicol-sensitive protein RarD